MKFEMTTEHGRRVRRYAGIVNDYTLRGSTRDGWVLYAEAWTKVHQQRLFRVIHTRTMREAIRKIERSEALAIELYGSEKHERTR